ncbi:MAG: hypothetical protein II467_03100, partial [Bacilli bacterium]|nr:hypothetical protein [Bacilli bacterium]
MKFNKAIIVPLALASFALSGCFIDNGPAPKTDSSDVSMSSKPRDVKTVSGRIRADYGSLEEGATTLLFGDIHVPFYPGEFGIDYIAAGDFAEISYKGEWVRAREEPSYYDPRKATIVDVKVTHCHIAEFEVAAVPGGGKSLRALDASVSVGELTSSNCIYRDTTFEDWESYPAGTKIYGMCSAKEKKAKVFALYSYDPSERKEILSLKESFSWIRKLKEEDIAMVISGHEHGSIDPTFETLNSYFYSDASSDIKRVYDYLNSTNIIIGKSAWVPGDGSLELIVVTKSGEKRRIVTSDRRLAIIFAGQEGALDKPLPSFSNLYGNSFMWQAVCDIEVSSLDEKVDYTASFPRIKSLEEMIFQEIENPSFSGEPNEYNAYKFSCDCGEIVFESNTDFTLHSEEGKTHYYRVVNDITFEYLKGGPQRT